MKSPTSSVGRIEELGILNGSATKERSRNTMSRTGKKLFGYSIHHGSGSSGRRGLANARRSASAMTPVITVRMNRIRAKFIAYPYCSAAAHRTPARDYPGTRGPAHPLHAPCAVALFVANLKNRQERLLGNFHAAYRFHAFLSRLLLFEELALAGDVAPIAFGEYVLA